jgi:hypothetical protein
MADRRLYVEIAQAISELAVQEAGTPRTYAHGVADAAGTVADVFERRSRNFDRALFLRNCGIAGHEKE